MHCCNKHNSIISPRNHCFSLLKKAQVVAWLPLCLSVRINAPKRSRMNLHTVWNSTFSPACAAFLKKKKKKMLGSCWKMLKLYQRAAVDSLQQAGGGKQLHMCGEEVAWLICIFGGRAHLPSLCYYYNIIISIIIAALQWPLFAHTEPTESCVAPRLPHFEPSATFLNILAVNYGFESCNYPRNTHRSVSPSRPCCCYCCSLSLPFFFSAILVLWACLRNK